MPSSSPINFAGETFVPTPHLGASRVKNLAKVMFEIIGPFFGPNAYKERIRRGSHLGPGIRGLHGSQRKRKSESGEIRL